MLLELLATSLTKVLGVLADGSWMGGRVSCLEHFAVL